MTPRPRRQGRKDWPAHLTPHKRKAKDGTVHTYYGWEDPRTGKEVSLEARDNLTLAKERAAALNALYAQEKQAGFIRRLYSPAESGGHSFGEWCAKYLQIIASTRRLAPATLKSAKSATGRLRDIVGADTPLLAVTVEKCAGALSAVRDEGKLRMAQSLRSTGIDLFNEAKREGWFPADRSNPMELTRNPEVPVTRSRLSLEAFRVIVATSEKILQPWAANSQWLALLSAQRREDVAEFQFRRGRDWEGLLEEYFEARRQKRDSRLPHPYPHVHQETLWVVQQKTGKLIRIPLDLRLEAVGMSLGDAVARCRDQVASRYMLHHVRKRTWSKPGDQVFLDTITKAFAKARDASGLTWAGTPPTYHENRSLAARLYTDERGADFAQGLLGHSDPRTTATYRDTRGHEWLEVQVMRGTK